MKRRILWFMAHWFGKDFISDYIFFSENAIVEDDLNRLVQIFNEGRYTPAIAGLDSENENIPSMEEFEKLHKMFRLATMALKVIKIFPLKIIQTCIFF